MNFEEEPGDVIQIIPGTGWTVIYWWEPDEFSRTPLACWGLTRGGDIVPYDTDSTGFVEQLNESEGFLCLEADSSRHTLAEIKTMIADAKRLKAQKAAFMKKQRKRAEIEV